MRATSLDPCLDMGQISYQNLIFSFFCYVSKQFFFFTIFSRDVQIVYRLDFCCLCYRTTTLVSILFTRLWSVGTVMAFRYKGKLVTSQQNFYFFSVFCLFIFSCRLVVVLTRAIVVDSPEIPGFCVSEIEQCLETINK